MGFFKKLERTAKKFLGGFISGGIGGGVARALGSGAGSPGQNTVYIPAPVAAPSLPPAAYDPTASPAGLALELYRRYSNRPTLGPPRPARGAADPYGPFYRRRPRHHGLTFSDIRGARRVAHLVKAFGYRPTIGARHHTRRKCA